MPKRRRSFNAELVFLASSPGQLERNLATFHKALRQLARRSLMRFDHEAGPKRRCLDWKGWIRDQLEQMRQAHESGYETAPYDAIEFCLDTQTPQPRWALDAVLAEKREGVNGETRRKKPGRHSRPAVRQGAMLRDWLCYWWVSALHHDPDVSWKAALIETAERLGMKQDAVRKAYGRVKDRKKTDYFSEVVASVSWSRLLKE